MSPSLPITSLCLLWLRRRCKTSGWRPVVAVIDWINASHWFLARLFFDYMCHQPRRACDHENAVESGGVYSQVGKDRTDRAVHIYRQRPFRVAEGFFDGARRRHVHTVHAGFPREFEQARSAWVLRVKTV